MKGKLFLILILLILPELVLAQTIESCNINFDIIQGKVLAAYSLNFEETGNTSLSFLVPEDTRSVSAFVNNETVEHLVEESNGYKKIILDINGDTETVKLSYITNSFLEATKKNYFLTDIKVPFDTEKLMVKLTLPEGAVLDKPVEAGGAVFPDPKKVETDGQHIIINWEKENMEKDSGLSIFVIYRARRSLVLPVILIIIVVAVIVYGVYYFIKRKPAPTHLLNPEKAVINALRMAKNNELWQKQIQHITKFSKAKLSRLIFSMEERGLIEKIPVGNTNKIKLK